MKTTKVRIGAVLAAVLVAGGTLAGAMATQGGSDATAGGRGVERETIQDAGEPIVFAGSYGLYPSK